VGGFQLEESCEMLLSLLGTGSTYENLQDMNDNLNQVMQTNNIPRN
jgi:hypothetical protein